MNTKIRHISYCILAALLMVACHEESHPLAPDTEEVAISMNATAVESMETSRALITENSGLRDVGFAVYATKKVASNNTPTLVFDNVNVTFDDTKGWDYSPKRYWDRTATYNFVAYAPYSINKSTSYASSTNTLTISNIPYWQAIDGNEIDYLVAHSSGTAEKYLSNTTSTAVSFNFSHILSQFIVHIVKDGNFAHTAYKVTKVEYINVPASNGTANYTNTNEFTGITAASTIERFSGENEVTQTAADNTLSHLVVPFTLSGDSKVQIKITYTVEGTERTKTVDTGINALTANNMYELTLTFRGAEIKPTLAVKDWVDEPVDEDPKYNW